MPADHTTDPIDDPALFAWLAAVDRQWRRSGVATTSRLRLRGELEQDLATALESGATVADLTTDDPVEFAERVAQATEWAPPPSRPFLDRWRASQRMQRGNVVGTCLAGAVFGGVVAIFAVFPYFYFEWLPGAVAGLLTDVLGAGVALGFAVLAVALRFRDDPGMRASLAPIGVGMGLGGAVSIAPTMILAGAFDYTSDASVVLPEVALVTLCCAGGILAGRWVAVRRAAQPKVDSLVPHPG